AELADRILNGLLINQSVAAHENGSGSDIYVNVRVSDVAQSRLDFRGARSAVHPIDPHPHVVVIGIRVGDCVIGH
ncbi:MAG: hypothetical protein ABL996_16065, partial [Micropepsaceae bacterium]